MLVRGPKHPLPEALEPNGNRAPWAGEIEHGEAVDEERKAECHSQWPLGHAEAVCA